MPPTHPDEAATRRARRRQMAHGVSTAETAAADDALFWKNASDEERIAAVVSLAYEWMAMHGMELPPKRLRRSHGGVRRR